ncbi:MAG: DUF418 domain-containing protein [Gammaproteobacteria bacterium]|nr:DUF418 domain-containing protein [Gammaproteobacteria bacterium]
MTQDSHNPAATRALAPITVRERIEALDVIRGIALIGIFLMNVEWFTRPIAELGTGVDVTQTGLSYAASWFIYTFVQGKFWTMFSLLFGMGFAVMLTRSEDNQRAFVTPYLRRIVGLFLFGSAHFVMLWTGDILHNYAVTALALLLIVTRGWKAWFAILLSVAATGLASGSDSWWTTGAFLAIAALAGVMVFRTDIDRWYKLAGMVAAAVAAAVALGPTSEGMAVSAGVMGLLAVFIYFLNRGPVSRFYKFGVALYMVPLVLGLGYLVGTLTVPSMKPNVTVEQQKQRDERLVKRAEEIAAEKKLYSTGTYAESVRHRAKEYAEEMPKMAEGGMFALSLFLIGFWFVRSGVMTNIRDNLAVFRRLASWALPAGLVLTLASVGLHSSYVPGHGREPTVILSRLLFELGALPLCLGYVSGLVLLMSTQWGARILSPLRHAGRMALTNYLGASLVASLYFFGYGLGHFGQVSRAGQVLFVAVVFGLQLIFSKLWLSYFLYGPMEWLWRAITYWQLPPMRREAPSETPAIAHA